MRKLILVAAAVLFVIPVSAQVHQATPLEVLLARLGVTHDHEMAAMPAHDMQSMQWNGSAVTMDATPAPQASVMAAVNATTAKTFNITARQFSFTVDPSPFVVNAGDNVTLNISVPSSDGSAVGHGFFLETFMTDQLAIARGKTVTIQFTATTPGTFTYLCTVASCGTGHAGMNGILTVLALAPAPAISAITPSSGPATGGNSLTIAGSNFQAGASVSLGGTAAGSVIVVNSSTITAQVPAHAAGRVSVVVTNPDNQSVTFDGYTYVAAPAITSISPTSGPSTGGTQITITGSGFVAGATVTIGGLAATSVTVVSATTITAATPAFAPTEQLSLPKNVVVTNPDGQSATLTGAFTYALPALAITFVDPDGAAPAGGITVTISGSGFTTALDTTVTFGGVAATNVTVLNTNAIRVTVPAHAAGVVDVTVTAGSNSATLKNGFTYGTAPPRKRAARH